MTTTIWGTRETEEVILDNTALASLGAGSNKTTSTPVSNDGVGEKFLYADIELTLGTQGTARDSGAYVALYFLPTLDDTNYTFGGDSLDPPASAWVANFPFDAAVTARTVVLTHILLPNSNFHVLVINETGQTLGASGNNLSMRRYGVASS